MDTPATKGPYRQRRLVVRDTSACPDCGQEPRVQFWVAMDSSDFDGWRCPNGHTWATASGAGGMRPEPAGPSRPLTCEHGRSATERCEKCEHPGFDVACPLCGAEPGLGCDKEAGPFLLMHPHRLRHQCPWCGRKFFTLWRYSACYERHRVLSRKGSSTPTPESDV